MMLRWTLLLAAALPLAACSKSADETAAKDFGYAPAWCAYPTSNTKVCLNENLSLMSVANSAGDATFDIVASDSTVWDGAKDYVGSGYLGHVAGFGYTTVKLVAYNRGDDDIVGQFLFLGTTGFSSGWYYWPGTDANGSFEIRKQYPVPCCKHP